MKKLRRNLTKILTTAAVVAIAFGISLLNPLAQLTNGLRNRVTLAAAAGEITRRPTLANVGNIGINPKVANMPKSTAKLGDTVATLVDDTDGIHGNEANKLQITTDFTTYTFDKLEADGYTLQTGETTTSNQNDGELDTITVTVSAEPEVRVFFGLPATRYTEDTYKYAGNYEYRFYLGEHFADDQYFDSVTVTVSKSQYSFSSPITGNNENFVPTTLPKGTTELKLPFPEKVNVIKDGVTIDLMDKKNLDDLNEFFKEHNATKSNFNKDGTGDGNFDAAIKQLQTYVRVSVHPNGGNTIIKDFTDTATTVTFAFGTGTDAAGDEKISTNATALSVSYQLLSEPETGAVLLSTQLTDISIKSFGKDDISFTGTVNTNSPTLSWGVETTLPLPSIGTATPNNTTESLTVPSTEAYTWVASVKYKANTATEWSSVTPITASNETIELLGGLKVRALKVGFYRFTYRTTTKWGYRHKDSDGNFVAQTAYIEYETADVEVRYNTTTTNVIWTDAYIDKLDEDGELDGIEMEDLDDFSKYLPTSNGTAEKATTVALNTGIVIPALYAENSILKQDELDYRITILNEDNGFSNSNTASQIRSSNGYDPTQKLYITFGEEPVQRENVQQYNVRTGGVNSTTTPNNTKWNDVTGFMNSSTIVTLTGKYRINVSVFSRKQMNPSSSSTIGNSLTSSSQMFYFTVEDNELMSAAKAPEIGEINIDNHYMADSDTLTVNVPANLFTDDYTMAENISREYYLIGKTTGVKLDEVPNSAGKLIINLTKYEDEIDFNNDNTLRVVVNGFNQMQKELYNNTAGTAVDDNINKTPNDQTTKDILFKIYDLDNWTNGDVDFTFNGGDGTTTGTDTNPGNFDDELWEKALVKGADSSNPKVYAQNENIYLPKIAAAVTPADTQTQMSVSVFQVDENGKHIRTGVYVNREGKPSIVGPQNFMGTGDFTDMYFLPSTAGNYFVFVTAKAKASDTYFSFLTAVSVKAAGRANIDVSGGSTALVVGETGFLPNITLNVIGDKIITSDRKLKFDINGDGTLEEVGYYDLGIFGIDELILNDKSITAKYDGMISVDYTFHLTDPKYDQCDGGAHGDPLTYSYNITVSQISAADLEVGVDERYGNEFPETAGGADHSIIEGTASDNIVKPDGKVPVMGLNDFLHSNTTFSVDRSKSNNWEKDKPVYPMIAIPNLNVYGRDGIELDPDKKGLDIKVTYVDNLNSTRTLIDTANDDETKRLMYGSVKLDNNYYAFKPQGLFVELGGNGPNAPTDEDYYTYNSENFIYTITYTAYYGNSEPVTKTFTVKTGDRTETTINIGNVGKRLNDDGTAVETDPLVYTYKTDMDAIKLDISNIKVDGNEHFQTYIENWILDNYIAGQDKAENIISLIDEGYYDEDAGQLTPEGRALSRARYIGKYIMVFVTINGADWAYSESYRDQHSMSSNETYLSRLDNNMQKQDYIPTNGGGTDTYIVGTDGVMAGDFEKTIYTFKPKQAGTYEVTFSIYNEITKSTPTAKVSITVNADDSSTSDIKNDAKKIWGWILIILSSGLLIGVVFYFIKTGRDTKFGGAPKPEGKKIKASKEVGAPKADEAPVKEKTEEKEAK